MRKKLLLIGGGHAHLDTLSRLEEFIQCGVEVSVIQPSPYHYYSGMGPGMLGGTYEPEDIRFATKELVESKGGLFIEDSVRRIDGVRQHVHLEESSDTVQYDLLSCNVGSFVPELSVLSGDKRVFLSKPIEKLHKARKRILALCRTKKIHIGILGGGPSSVEIAGNIHHLCSDSGLVLPEITILCRGFMSGRPSKVRNLARNILRARGVDIVENCSIKTIDDLEIALEDGSNVSADLVFSAIGVQPSKIFSRSGLNVSPDGGLRVNSFLQSTSYSNIFGGGDCIHFEDQPLDKVGVYAVRQNPVLCENLLSFLAGKPLQKFSPGGAYLLILNLGCREGIFSKWSITFSGKTAFRIKDFIDRKFMQSYSF
jgi:NADH dehydrogenase FAD-containing subunit